MNRHIIYNYSQALTERLSGYSLIPRVENLCNIDEIVTEVQKNNQLFCIWVDCSLMSISDLDFECVKTDTPIILYAYNIGDIFKTLYKVDLIRNHNIRIFLSSDSKENFHSVKILSSLGIDMGILLDSKHIDDDLFLDLASYALLGQVPHASIEPFDYIWRNILQEHNLDIDTIFFNNPQKYIYINDRLDFSFSLEDLNKSCFAGNLAAIDHIDFNTEVEQKLNRYYSHFFALDKCSKCPAFKVCDRKSIAVFNNCQEVYSTIYEYAEIRSNNESQNHNTRSLCQL